MQYNIEDKDFQCYLVGNEYQNLVDQQEIFKSINQSTGKSFTDYLKNEILNDQNKLDQLLQRINNQWKNGKVELQRVEIFTLIILMFLNLIQRKKQFGGFYIINMEYVKRAQSYLCSQKMLCIENYMKLFYEKKDVNSKCSFDNDEEIPFKHQVVTFIKNTQNTLNDNRDNKPIQVEITNLRNEDNINSTVVDFADQNIGGLTLDGYNCAQEEILMLIYPEAIVSMIFIPPMKANEAILIKNIKKFSKYTGYEQSFKCKQNQDMMDQYFNILAIDAKPFSGNHLQFKQENLQREILKCYIGFYLALQQSPNQNISTGRWGCGIFGGNQYLKTIIQLYCFAQAKYEINNNSTAKLIINSSSNTDLVNFVKKLLQFQRVLNLKNLYELIDKLCKYQFQNDIQFQIFIEKYFENLMKTSQVIE